MHGSRMRPSWCTRLAFPAGATQISGTWGVLSIEPRTVARHIQQHSIYQLTASEFFCKVSFVQVVENCAGSAPDPQAAWGSLQLRECTVPCYVNLMPWFTACGSQLGDFDELDTEQVDIINLQRTVCADYYGPYTGTSCWRQAIQKLPMSD